MLPKNERLNLKKDAHKSIFSAKFYTSKHFRVSYQRQKDFKAAAVIPVKQVKKAAWRNQLKRKVYVVIEQHRVRQQPVHMVVMLKKTIDNDFHLIQDELGALLDKISQRIKVEKKS